MFRVKGLKPCKQSTRLACRFSLASRAGSELKHLRPAGAGRNAPSADLGTKFPPDFGSLEEIKAERNTSYQHYPRG